MLSLSTKATHSSDPTRLRERQQMIRCAPWFWNTTIGLDHSTTPEVPVLRLPPSRETLPTSTLTGVVPIVGLVVQPTCVHGMPQSHRLRLQTGTAAHRRR